MAVMPRVCLTTGGTDALHKVDRAMKKKDHLEILQLHQKQMTTQLETCLTLKNNCSFFSAN